MVYLLLLVLGLCFGDFLTALVWRLHKGRNFVSERSECEHCHHQLSFRDTVPVIGWLLLRGRCRYCHKPINWQYPLWEVLAAVLFVGSYALWPQPLEGRGILHLVVWLIAIVFFMALTIYDLRWMLLPNSLVFPLLVIVLVAVGIDALFFGGGALAVRDAVLGILVLGGFFYLLFQLSGGRWIGGGDVKLGFIIGALVGGPIKSMVVLFMASVIGTAVSAPLLASHRLKVKAKIPFGPFLMAATLIVVLFGSALIDWYQHRVLGI